MNLSLAAIFTFPCGRACPTLRRVVAAPGRHPNFQIESIPKEADPSRRSDTASLKPHRIEFAQCPLEMGRAPVDSPAALASRKFLMARVHEGWYATHHGLARDLFEHFVTNRASRERPSPRIERKTCHYLADLVAEQMAFDVKHVGRGAEPLVARQHMPALLARELERFGARKRVVTKDIGAHQPEPSSEPREHPVGREFRCFVFRNLFHRQPAV